MKHFASLIYSRKLPTEYYQNILLYIGRVVLSFALGCCLKPRFQLDIFSCQTGCLLYASAILLQWHSLSSNSLSLGSPFSIHFPPYFLLSSSSFSDPVFFEVFFISFSQNYHLLHYNAIAPYFFSTRVFITFSISRSSFKTYLQDLICYFIVQIDYKLLEAAYKCI